MPITLDGRDNYGHPRQKFADKIAGLDDNGFLKQAEQSIWLSAYAGNNPRADYHWQADACYKEARARGKPELYERAWKAAADQT